MKICCQRAIYTALLFLISAVAFSDDWGYEWHELPNLQKAPEWKGTDLNATLQKLGVPSSTVKPCCFDCEEGVRYEQKEVYTLKMPDAELVFVEVTGLQCEEVAVFSNVHGKWMPIAYLGGAGSHYTGTRLQVISIGGKGFLASRDYNWHPYFSYGYEQWFDPYQIKPSPVLALPAEAWTAFEGVIEDITSRIKGVAGGSQRKIIEMEFSFSSYCQELSSKESGSFPHEGIKLFSNNKLVQLVWTPSTGRFDFSNASEISATELTARMRHDRNQYRESNLGDLQKIQKFGDDKQKACVNSFFSFAGNCPAWESCYKTP